MLINYEVDLTGEKYFITICKAFTGQYVGSWSCDKCGFNLGYVEGKDIKMVDCSCKAWAKKTTKIDDMLFSHDEVDIIRQAYNSIEDTNPGFLNDSDQDIRFRIQEYQTKLIEKSSGKKAKPEKGLGKTKANIGCECCYNHVKKEGDLCDFCLEKIRYSDEELTDEEKAYLDKAYPVDNKPNFEEYAKKVIAWGERVGLSEGSTLEKQMIKAVAEFGEFFDAILLDFPDEVEEELGDHLVVLVQICDRYFKGEKTLANSLKVAYDKINSRSGKMVNGNFVKDGE